MKTIVITGGSGFVGKHLSQVLVNAGYKVIVFSRNKKPDNGNISFAQWNPDKKEMDTNALSRADGVVHLAGAGVADKRWTDIRKKEIISSRVAATEFLLEQLRAYAPQCKVLISASGTGYYGPDRGKTFTEGDPPYNDFLAQVCIQWEAAARKTEAFYRTVIFRFGIVLGKDGGAYPRLSDPMKFGIMPILGSGEQMVSWVHLEDVANMIKAALENVRYKGIYNAVAPNPVSHKGLMKAIGRAKGGIKIPLRVPAFVLGIIIGEASIEVLKSCTASPGKVMAEGYAFEYSTIERAINDLAGK